MKWLFGILTILSGIFAASYLLGAIINTVYLVLGLTFISNAIYGYLAISLIAFTVIYSIFCYLVKLEE